MKKIRLFISLALVLILSTGFNNANMVSATTIQSNKNNAQYFSPLDFSVIDEFAIAEKKSLEKYGKHFMEKQTEAYHNYEKLMQTFEEESDKLTKQENSFDKNSNTDDADSTVVSDDIVYPDYYAGSFTDEDGNLVVYKKENKKASAKLKKVEYENTAEKIEDALDNDDFILEEAEFSYNELNDVMDMLNTYKLTKDNAVTDNFNVYWLSDEDNCVYVELDNLTNEAIEKFKEKVCNSDAIEFLEATGEFEKETNIKAGRSLTCNGAGGSVGYRVKRNGNAGFVTAGHMGSVGDTVKIGGTKVGTIKARKESGSVDAAFVRVTNSNYTPVNTLSGTSNKLSTTISEPGVGTVINKLGATTGATTGKVISKNATVTLDGITHKI